MFRDSQPYSFFFDIRSLKFFGVFRKQLLDSFVIRLSVNKRKVIRRFVQEVQQGLHVFSSYRKWLRLQPEETDGIALADTGSFP